MRVGKNTGQHSGDMANHEQRCLVNAVDDCGNPG